MTRYLLLFFLFFSSADCRSASLEKKVAIATATLPPIPTINVTNADKFLNDLELSPYWKVEKNDDGDFEAHARSISSGSPFSNDGVFLSDLMSTSSPRLPEDYRLNNHYLEGTKLFTALSATIVFKKPLAQDVSFYSGTNTKLGIFDSWEQQVGLNSFSTLAIQISKELEIYLLVREQGSDLARATTVARLPAIVEFVSHLASLPPKYRVENEYATLLNLLFQPPLKDQEIKRTPEIEDRDTFFGYFRVHKGTSYEGINIKISHPVYCEGECTRDYSRLRKAEWPGHTYFDSDIIFFAIEDNAVYLIGTYNKQFGTFSGTNSFDARLEVLNFKGQPLLETTNRFKGWEE